MGYIKHNTIVVTSSEEFENVKKIQEKAKSIFGENAELVSEIIPYAANTGHSFFIAPDGSKEGWGTSNDCDKARKEFLNWLYDSNHHCDYVEVKFGGDDDYENIVRSTDSDDDYR